MNNFNVTKNVRNEYNEMAKIVSENNSFVVLDLETTGLSPKKGGRIIEIGAIKIEKGKIIDRFETLIDPEMPIPESSRKIHGISDNEVKGKPIYQQVLPKFYTFIGDLPIVAHNSKFDWDRFLLHYFSTLGIYPKNATVDTIILSKVVLPANKGDRMNLKEVCERCNVSLEGAHRAINDAEATAKIFLMAKKRISLEPEHNQASLLDLNNEKIMETEQSKVTRNYSIIDANLWEKDFNDKSYKRIYVDLSDCKVFYDVLGGFWQTKEPNKQLDFEQIEVDFLEYAKSNKPKLLQFF